METNSGVFHKTHARTLLALMIGFSISGTSGCFGGSTESLDALADSTKTDTTTAEESDTDSEDEAVEDTTDDTTTDESEEAETPVTTNAKVSLFIDSPVLESGPDGEVKIFAYARDAESNAVLAGEEIRFSTSDGMLSAGSVTTNTMGYAETTLMSPYEYKSVSAVTITAAHANCTPTSTASCSASTQDLQIAGATLSITPKSDQVSAGDTASFNAVLVDGSENPIAKQWIGLFENCSDTTEILRIQTNDQGQAQLETTVPATNNSYSYCAKAIYSNSEWALSKVSDPITVSSDLILDFENSNADGGYSLAISDIDTSTSTPPLASMQAVEITLKNGTTATDGDTVSVTTTLGQISATGSAGSWGNSADIVVSNDAANFYLHSSTAGTANLTANYDDLLNKSTEVLFFSDTPAVISLSAALSTISQEESTTVRALVKDIDGVLVKGATVIFTVTDDITAGQLKEYSVVSNKDGVASTTYIAGNNTTGISDPVRITAAIENNTTVPAQTVDIIVEPIHTTIVIGTGNKITELNTTQFSKDFVVQVSDNGVPVASNEVELLVFPTRYSRGYLITVDTDGDGEVDQWAKAPGSLVCFSEDSDKNGLANPGVDGDAWDDPDNNGQLTPGTTAVAANPNRITTDENGYAYFTLTYPQNYAWWIEVEIEARSSRNGIQSSDTFTYEPALIATQVLEVEASPANATSPFGAETSNLNLIGSDELGEISGTSPSICQ